MKWPFGEIDGPFSLSSAIPDKSSAAFGPQNFRPLLAVGASPLHFELDGVEGSLEQMDGAVVGVDHQLSARPLGIFVSADEEFECELFENGVVD